MSAPTVVEAKFGKQPPNGLAADLRRMADAVDRGEVTDVAMCFVEADNYCYLWGASRADSIFMATLLQAQAIERMRA